MEKLHILHLEDSATDAFLVKVALDRGPFQVALLHVSDPARYSSALETQRFDVILVDNALPSFSGLEALEMAREKLPDVPVIIVSGAASEEQVLSTLKAGAEDYVLKENPWQLAAALWRIRVKAGGGRKTVNAESRHDAMAHLIASIQELSHARTTAEVMRIVRQAARELTSADGATFVLRENDQCYYADEDAIQPLWKGQRFPMSACISGWVMLNAQPAVIEDIYADPRVPSDAYCSTFVKSLVMVPIRPKAPIGAIGTYWAAPHRASDWQVELLQALANTTAVALENCQLYSELEQRVKTRTLQLKAANRELEAFSYSVSHDLKSPLSSIATFADILHQGYESRLDDEGKQCLHWIRSETRRMAGLVRDLLRLGQFTSAELRVEPVKLDVVAEEIVAILQRAAPERKVNFSIQNCMEVQADPGLMRVVVENLLSNAWKYTGKKEHAAIEFGSALQPDGLQAYFVRDNGAGFDMQYAGNLFAPFRRLHPAGQFAGTGVGLATVQRIINRHGGRVWADAEVDKGATFFFTLPQDTLLP
jgi:signal transduction histidine kinase/DNA-binding response OmpR family regulator